MKQFVKTLPKRHPLSVEIRDLYGAEGFTYLTDLLDLVQEIGMFELTPKIVARECGINAQKVARIFENLKRIFEESCNFLGLSSNKVSTKLEETSKKVPTFTPQNQHGSIRDEEEKREEKKNTPPTPKGLTLRFDEFWNEYPRKQDKAKAKTIWERKKLDAIADSIVEAVQRFKQSPQWQAENGRYVPKPTTFLNGDRWEDEVEPAEVQPKGGKIARIQTAKEVEINSGGESFWVQGKALQYVPGKNIFTLDGREYYVDQITITEE